MAHSSDFSLHRGREFVSRPKGDLGTKFIEILKVSVRSVGRDARTPSQLSNAYGVGPSIVCKLDPDVDECFSKFPVVIRPVVATG